MSDQAVACLRIPAPDDIAYPKGRSRGSWVRVVECQDDMVKFIRTDPNSEPYEVVNRLSTFLLRFDVYKTDRKGTP